jgi:hypothetical protein
LSIFQRQTGAQRLQGEGAVHGASLKVQQAEMLRQTPGNGALSGA